MSRSFTLKQLRERLQKMTDIQNDEHFSTEELNEIIESAACETLDHIISSGLSEQLVQQFDITVSPGQSEFDLTTYAPSFYKITKVFVKEGNTYRPIERINPGDIYPYQPINTSAVIRVQYIPYKQFTALGDYLDTISFDGINGWEEHTLVTAAMTVKAKKEEDASWFRSRKSELEDRMAFIGSTDFSGPARVQRKRKNRSDTVLPFQSTVSAWTLRNNSITFYYNYPWIP